MKQTIEDISSHIVEAMKSGKIFSCTFIKKDKSLRKMTARMGVTKHLKTDRASTTAHIPNYLTVFEIGKGKEQYRTINKDTIQSFKCGEVRV